MVSQMTNTPIIPDFIDSFHPGTVRQACLSQLVILRGALAQLQRFDTDLPLVSRSIDDIKFRIERLENYLNYILPHMLAWRATLRKLAEIDSRFICNPTREALSASIWMSLRKEESYRDFKFLAGEIVKLPGWKLKSGKQDTTTGSIDFTFEWNEVGTFTVIVRPGDSSACQIVEQTETRQVTVKKIICDGVETGEMPDARLANPQAPTLPESSHEEIPF